MGSRGQRAGVADETDEIDEADVGGGSAGGVGFGAIAVDGLPRAIRLTLVGARSRRLARSRASNRHPALENEVYRVPTPDVVAPAHAIGSRTTPLRLSR